MLALLMTPVFAQQPERSWVVQGGTIIDGTGAPPANGSVVVGRGDQIVCVGTACAIPPEARVIDAWSKWVIPGLIDTHVHVNFANPAVAERVQRLRFAFGITSTRDAGATGAQLAANLARSQYADSGMAAEPRLIASALMPVDKPQGSPSDLDRLVREYVEHGADAIKIKGEYDAAQLTSIVTAAHAAGVPVFGHTWSVRGSQFEPALEAGVDGLSHMQTFAAFARQPSAGRPAAPEDGVEFWVWDKEIWNYQDDARLAAAIDLVAARRAWVEPMLVTERYITLPYPLDPQHWYLDDVKSLRQIVRPFVPYGSYGRPAIDNRRKRLEVVFARMCDVVKQLHARGVVVVAGTDDAQPGPALSEEIRLLATCGLDPLEALRAATRDAAAAIGSAQVGTIEAGKLGDLVILDADPLENPVNLLRVSRVLKAGFVYDPRLLLAPFIKEHGQSSRGAWTVRAAALVGLVAVMALVVTWRRGSRRRRSRERRIKV